MNIVFMLLFLGIGVILVCIFDYLRNIFYRVRVVVYSNFLGRVRKILKKNFYEIIRYFR